MLRHPAVAGHFYRRSPEALRKQVEEFVVPVKERKRVIGIVSPHAGLMYSGSVAGAVYSTIEIPDTIILIGPNHTGLGAPVSLMGKGAWETPLGTIEIDDALAASIFSRSHLIQEDSLAHLREHSLEVQLPFIQYFKSFIKIVPMQMLDTRYETCVAVGNAVAEAISSYKSQGADVLIVASSDMSHYERAEVAKEKDFKAISCILELDAEGLYKTVRAYGITMCGFGPAVAMILAARKLGAASAELIKYANSGEVSGDYDQVVGYAGIIVF
jgi:AmmeMemoRadiSam system protein B